MNGFLWLGVVGTAVLIVAFVFDGLGEALDALDLGPSWLSLPVIAGFLAAFGFGTGAFYGLVGPLALVPGVLVGVAFSALAVRLTAAVMDMPTGRTDTEEAMLGSLGRVVTPPEPGRYGEVLLHRPAGPVKVACTAPGRLPAGTEIVVVDVVSASLVAVEAFDVDGPGELPASSGGPR